MGYRLAAVFFAALLATIWLARPGIAAPATLDPPPHIVRAGETLWSIGRMHGLPPAAIAQANGLPSPDRLRIGQRLALSTPRRGALPASARSASPPSDVHVVQTGETLWSIAQRHGLSVDALATLNRLADANRLRLGQNLVLRRTPVARPAAPRRSSTTGAARAAPRVAAGFAWPSRGVITSRFGFRGRRHHHGIDIAAPAGTPITAARAGTVQFAGWLGGYGQLVILDHGGGLTTYYGHASRLLVRVGDPVQRGQLVARVGTTGNVTGPNVHFEVRNNKVPLDPLAFLQNQRSQPLP